MTHNDMVNCVNTYLHKWYVGNNHFENALNLVDDYDEQIRADERRKFAEKIKSHMMKYCFKRIEQQYCAIEVIDYIGKLMGEENFSIDVEKEMARHDSKIRADERAKTINELIYELKHRETTIYETGFMCHEYSDDELDEIAEQIKGVQK